MTESEKRDLREHCLEMAIAVCGCPSDPDQVLLVADRFFNSVRLK